MANQEHLDLLLESSKANNGMQEWNQWRQDNPETQMDFRRADLHGAILHDADLSAANLSSANLSKAQGFIYFQPGAQPRWPLLPVDRHQTLNDEAGNPAIPPSRLQKIANGWPGYVVWESLVSNPSLPERLLITLGACYPQAFLGNLALPWLFLECPGWLSANDAHQLLTSWDTVLGDHPWEAAHPQIFRLIHLRAGRT